MTHVTTYPKVESPEEWKVSFTARRRGQELYHAGQPCPVEPGAERSGWLYELGAGQYCRDLPCPTDPDAARGWHAMLRAESQCTYDDLKAAEHAAELRRERQYQQEQEARRWLYAN